MDQDIPGSSSYDKPAETRMGKGKGSPEHWIAVVKQDASCLSIRVNEELHEAMRLASHKLPVKCKFIKEKK